MKPINLNRRLWWTFVGFYAAGLILHFLPFWAAMLLAIGVGVVSSKLASEIEVFVIRMVMDKDVKVNVHLEGEL